MAQGSVEKVVLKIAIQLINFFSFGKRQAGEVQRCLSNLETCNFRGAVMSTLAPLWDRQVREELRITADVHINKIGSHY